MVEGTRETACKVSDAAYNAWARYRSALKKMLVNLPNEDLDGSYDRLPTKAMRIATLVASVQGSNEITLNHWALAQEVAESWRASLHHLYAQVNMPGGKAIPTLEEKILECIKTLHSKGNETVSARDVGRALHKDSKEIVPYLLLLAEEGELEEVKGRQSPRYRLTGTK